MSEKLVPTKWRRNAHSELWTWEVHQAISLVFYEGFRSYSSPRRTHGHRVNSLSRLMILCLLNTFHKNRFGLFFRRSVNRLLKKTEMINHHESILRGKNLWKCSKKKIKRVIKFLLSTRTFILSLESSRWRDSFRAFCNDLFVCLFWFACPVK